MDSAFLNAKPSYTTINEEINSVLGKYRNGWANQAFNKHIDSTFTLNIIRNTNSVAIYYSPIQSKVLLVYHLTGYHTANINADFNPHSKWQLNNLNISGAKLYVLFNPTTMAYFHAHIRLKSDDLEQMRHSN